MSELFTSEFVDAISRLRIKARQVPRGGRHAEQASVQMGGGMEFRDFRPYAAGDDFRRIDWNLYSRSGMLFLRLFEELRDEEVVHQTLVREALRGLPRGPEPDPDDYADEPVGH